MKPLQRRTVYAGTIVSMLIIASGFVLASGIPWGGLTSNTIRGNQQVINGADTIYSPGLTSEMFLTQTGPGSCSTSVPISGTADVNTGWMAGGSGATCSASSTDYYLQLTFNSGTSLAASTYQDTFVVSSEFGASTSTFTTSDVNVTCTLSASGQCSVTLNIDTGVLSSASQPVVESIEVTISGS